MRVLDLFAGLCGWSAPFAARGHDVFSVDLDTRFDVSLHADVLTLTAADLPWKPDIILASPPCEGFSVMNIGKILEPPCKNGDPCHVRAPRGSRTGTQGYGTYAEKSLIPYPLADAVRMASEADLAAGSSSKPALTLWGVA